MTDRDPAEPDCPLNEGDGLCPQTGKTGVHLWPDHGTSRCYRCGTTCQCALITRIEQRRGVEQGAGDDCTCGHDPRSHTNGQRCIGNRNLCKCRQFTTPPIQGPDAEAIAAAWERAAQIIESLDSDKGIPPRNWAVMWFHRRQWKSWTVYGWDWHRRSSLAAIRAAALVESVPPTTSEGTEWAVDKLAPDPRIKGPSYDGGPIEFTEDVQGPASEAEIEKPKRKRRGARYIGASMDATDREFRDGRGLNG